MDLLAAMRVFVRVVERGSLSTAARDLGMGQPAVSDRIARLEDHLGEKLLLRNTRSLRPTDVGFAFYERSKKTLEAAVLAESVTRKNKNALRGTVRVAAPHGLGEIVLPQLLMRFRKLHPHLAIELILNDRMVNPTTEGVDVSVRLGNADDGNCMDEMIGVVKRVLVASPDYIVRFGAPSTVEELRAHPFMRVAGIFNDNLLPLIRQGEPVEAAISTAWTVSNWRPLHALLMAGAGIGVLQLPACMEAVAGGQLKRLLPQYEVPGFKLRLLYPRVAPIPERTRQLVAFLKNELQFYGDS